MFSTTFPSGRRDYSFNPHANVFMPATAFQHPTIAVPSMPATAGPLPPHIGSSTAPFMYQNEPIVPYGAPIFRNNASASPSYFNADINSGIAINHTDNLPQSGDFFPQQFSNAYSQFDGHAAGNTGEQPWSVPFFNHGYTNDTETFHHTDNGYESLYNDVYSKYYGKEIQGAIEPVRHNGDVGRQLHIDTHHVLNDVLNNITPSCSGKDNGQVRGNTYDASNDDDESTYDTDHGLNDVLNGNSPSYSGVDNGYVLADTYDASSDDDESTYDTHIAPTVSDIGGHGADTCDLSAHTPGASSIDPYHSTEIIVSVDFDDENDNDVETVVPETNDVDEDYLSYPTPNSGMASAGPSPLATELDVAPGSSRTRKAKGKRKKIAAEAKKQAAKNSTAKKTTARSRNTKETAARIKKTPKASVKKNESISLYFNSLASALIHDDTPAWKPPAGDETIPQTNSEEQAVVRNLMSAFLNKEAVNDNKFERRWGETSNYYAEEDLEKLAWRILACTIKLHTEGWKEPVYDKGLLAQIERTWDFSFAKRMECIVNLVRHNKRVCEDLLRGEKLSIVVGAPGFLERRAKSNKGSNKRKADRIKYATEHMEPVPVKRKRGGGVEDGEGMDEEERGVKRSKTAK
ncbi:hypothetical protein BDV95DRAFT_591229 [Massariosphaeria phaeospora]|uniref:Uncharacterized protein n=1 Tax=Massariosphaeria phaeospora TaxID=100035 RepID=A0A7C8MDT0_9PLEO|nr:hypothetical protein BDV95DRAFT_591229 [Massariosphaeria phaeospora]